MFTKAAAVPLTSLAQLAALLAQEYQPAFHMLSHPRTAFLVPQRLDLSLPPLPPFWAPSVTCTFSHLVFLLQDKSLSPSDGLWLFKERKTQPRACAQQALNKSALGWTNKAPHPSFNSARAQEPTQGSLKPPSFSSGVPILYSISLCSPITLPSPRRAWLQSQGEANVPR